MDGCVLRSLFPKEFAKQEDWLVNKLSKKPIGRYEEIKITICRDRRRKPAVINKRSPQGKVGTKL